MTRPLDPSLDPESVCAALRTPRTPVVFFDGRGDHGGAWPCRVAIASRVLAQQRGAGAIATGALDDSLARRRKVGGPGGTGIAVLCTYEAFSPGAAASGSPWDVALVEVDACVEFPVGAGPIAHGPEPVVEAAAAVLERRRPLAGPTVAPSGRPFTSLPRAAYLRAVAQVKRHIEAGDIYQANLTQRFDAAFAGDPFDLYRALRAATPAPRSAYVELPGLALASVSPEVFVDVDRDGSMETRPIKGTRPRGPTPGDDRKAADDLLASEKDRAELVMIVDVLRNDLGRVARTGTVTVPELHALRSYAAVHHLVARVVAERRPGVTAAELVAAVFPGGSITGAPKQRAVELLAGIETCPRGLYTGSLFWFDDDGSMASSILIRSAIVTGGRVFIGAGGGIVADSEPEAEWAEANAKARALTRALGFEPEEAA